MSDEIFLQLDRGLFAVDSEESLQILVELATAIQPTWEHVSEQLLVAAKLSTPSRALFLIKFTFLLGKKDNRFFKNIRHHVPAIVLYCYQVAEDRDSSRLYITSWLMNSQWKEVAETALGIIRAFDQQERLRLVLNDLEKTDLLHSKRNFDIEILEKRLNSVVNALNGLT
jgi:hypothetical protein